MTYRLIAIGRSQDGETILMLGGNDVAYEVTEETAWKDLNEIIDDDELPEPEPLQKVTAGVQAPSAASLDFIEQVVAETYGPLYGRLMRNGAVGLFGLMKRL